MEAMTMYSHEGGKDSCEDLMKISKIIGLTIDGTVREIVRLYKMELLSGPVDYIVPAVWGAKKDGDLDATQKEIHTQLSPVVNRIIDLFKFEEKNDAQEFALGFLIKSLFISKICYMIDGVKKGFANKLGRRDNNTSILSNVEMLGSAGGCIMAAAKRYFNHVFDREKLTERELALLWVMIIHEFCEVRIGKMQGSETALILWLAENAMNKLPDMSAKKWLFEKIKVYKARRS